MSAERLILPTPLVRARELNAEVLCALRDEGADAWLSEFLARRLDQPMRLGELTNPSLGSLPDPSTIPSMDRAVERVVRAVQSGERVVFACDHDMDGTASAAVLWSAFSEHFGVPPDRLHVVTSHRLTEGYGITEPVVQRIVELRPGLVISADKGSSDEARIAVLASAGIDVIVTDHHQIPADGPPRSAYAVVNPTRADSRYDPNICGAGVAFLLMAKVRTALLGAGWRSEIASLAGLLDFVAVATIADCVTMLPTRSYANRVFVKKGIELINRKRRACWEIFAEETKGGIDVEDVAFRLAPAIAAAGRLDWADAGFRFLVARTPDEARSQWAVLKRENAERKEIEKVLRAQAFAQAVRVKGAALVLYLEQGHAGVHGITANRLVETFGKPAAVFSPKGAGARPVLADMQELKAASGLAAGSFRGVRGLDVRRALERVAERHPGLLVSFGGHPAAAGAVVATGDVERFAAAYEQAVIEQLGSDPLRPVLWTDGELPPVHHSLDALDALAAVGPFGRGFEAPLYQGCFRIRERRLVGEGAHLRLGLERDEARMEAIWFRASENEDASRCRLGEELFLAYQLSDNRYNGRRSVQAIVRYGSRPPSA